MIAAINNSSLVLAGRKKRNVSGEVAATQSTTQAPSSIDSDCVKLTSPGRPVNGNSTSKKAKCADTAPSGRASSSDAKSPSTSEDTSGTVAKVAERRKSELTLTIKCSQTEDIAKDVSSDDDGGGGNDVSDSSSSSSSSSNSEDEMESPAKRPFSSAVDHKPRANHPTTAKTTVKKQQSTDSDSSQGSSVTEARRSVAAPSSSVSAGGAGQTPSKATKRKKSTNSRTPSGKRRRKTSTSSQVGCESTLLLLKAVSFVGLRILTINFGVNYKNFSD